MIPKPARCCGNATVWEILIDLIAEVQGDLASITADAAYDTRGIYNAAGERGAAVLVPPIVSATVRARSKPRCAARDRTVRRVAAVGRREWKRESGYHRQGTIENAFFRYKQIIGPQLRARDRRAQEVEALLACNILNRMTGFARPKSYPIGV